jgi:DNA gyrase/topoisomerase IV subunit B
MAKDKKYTGADIQALSDREHVRLRTQVYLGNMHPATYSIPLLTEDQLQIKEVEFIPAVYKAIGEVIDNAVDEFSHLTSKIKLLKIEAKPDIGWYSISDNGRGIPIDTHGSGLPTPQVALGSLKAGRNFTDEKEVGVIGQNGVGAACTNYCSSEFDVTIHRDKKTYFQRFIDGADKVSRPKISSYAGTNTGTQVSFQLDPAVFKSVTLPEELIRNRAIEIAMTNPDVTVEYNGERYRYKKGLLELVAQIAADKQFYCFEVNEQTLVGEVFVILNAHEQQDEQMYTWINSSLLFDGGKINTQFFNALFERVITHLSKDAKKTKTEVTRNDVRQGLLVLANLKVKNPEYDSQAKTRLTGPDLRKEISTMIDGQWKMFAKRTEVWMATVLERANERHHRQADKEAQKEHEKKINRRVAGLLDATSRVRMDCQILITEGESASSQISQARDPKTIAAFALTGKINNVYGTTPAQALKMGKITELLAAIGLTPGKKATVGDLNYSKIVIATDADFDGDDIFTLLINLFHHFWPELFDKKNPPVVHRLIAPNVCLVKGKQRIHFSRRSDYDKVKDKYSGYEVRYYKGLGSMAKEDWEMVLSGKTDTLIPFYDDGMMEGALTLLFSDNAEARKKWLTVD